MKNLEEIILSCSVLLRYFYWAMRHRPGHGEVCTHRFLLIQGPKQFQSEFFFFFEDLYQLPWQLSWERICLQCRRPRFDSWVRKIPWRRDRLPTSVSLGFPCGSVGKESTCKAGDLGSVLGLRRSPGGGKDYPLQYSGLENSPWSRKELDKTDFYFHFHQVLWSNRLIQKTVSDLNNWIWKKKIFSLFPKRPWYNRHGTCSVKAVS